MQSRPITTLYPVPEANDQAPHVYISVGHQQMMTDTMPPLGLALWLMTTPASMRTAGGRLFVDVAPMLASPNRAAVLNTLGQSDTLIKDALTTILDRGFIHPHRRRTSRPRSIPCSARRRSIENDPAIVAGLIDRSQASIATLRREIATMSGPALFDFIVHDMEELKKHLREPRSSTAILAAMAQPRGSTST